MKKMEEIEKEKKKLEVSDLLRKFDEAGSTGAVNDRMVLS